MSEGGKDLTRLARWIVPGWIFAITILFFVFVDIGSSSSINDNKLFLFITTLYQKLSVINITLLGLLFTLAGIPIGFWIYQIYFFFRFNSPFSINGLLPPLLPSLKQELEKTTEGIEKKDNILKWIKDIPFNKPLKNNAIKVQWRFFESLFIEASQYMNSDEDKNAYGRFRYLHEMVHILGASMASTLFAFLIYILFKVIIQDVSASLYISIPFSMLFILFFLLNVKEDGSVKINEGEKEQNIISFNLHNLFKIAETPALFLLFIFFLHFFNNPRLITKANYLYINSINGKITINLDVLNPKNWTQN